ncbi:hypothetical protein F6Y03_30975 [Bacillus megaterium]|nr:hypothetical protein [Priestia megaterium]
MYKGKAKTRLVLDKTYQKGQTVELTEEQYKLLGVYLEDVKKVEQRKKLSLERLQQRKQLKKNKGC